MRARSIKIIDLSVHTVATIPLGTSVLDCSKAMRALHVGSLVVINDDRQPVVDKDDKLCGIVTANNIVEEISEQLDSIVRAIKSSKTREQSVRP